MEYAVNLPSIFQSPGQALQAGTEQLQRQGENIAQMNMRQQQMEEAKAERDEQKLFRNTQLIEGLTDMSKFETASDVANALGYDKARQIKSKYIRLAMEGKLNPADIVTGIDKEIGSTTQAMRALQLEHSQFDKLATVWKQQHPDLDMPTLMKDYRSDLIKRRLKAGETGTDFTNPMEVGESDFIRNLNDPRNLSTYVRGNKAFTTAIEKPDTRLETAFVGSPMQNMKWEAKIPYWEETNIKPEQVSGGFLPKGFQPQLRVKGNKLPVESLPAAKGEFSVVDRDVYDKFSQNRDAYMGLVNTTRKTYPTYDSMPDLEKEYAERNVLYNSLQGLGNKFIATDNTRAPIDRGTKPTESEKRSEIIGGYIGSFTEAVRSGNEAQIRSLANKFYGLKGGKANYEGVQIFKRPDGSVTGFQVNYTKDNGDKMKSDVIAVNDPNLEDKVQGMYQKISGSETAAEISNLKDLSETKQPVKLNLIDGKLPQDQFKKLVKGQLYNVNGKSYLWNGQKFQPK